MGSSKLNNSLFLFPMEVQVAKLQEQVKEAWEYAEAIVSTIREPLLVLDKHLRVKTANRSYYRSFQVNKQETVGRLIYEVDNQQWNIPDLRELLEKILPEKSSFKNFEIKHTFESIGERILLLNAREMTREREGEKLILLAMEDITEIRNKTQKLRLREKDLFNKNMKKEKSENRKLEKLVKERTSELANANRKLLLQNDEKEKRASELIVANQELVLQNLEKEKRAAELLAANKELQSIAFLSSHDLQEPLRKIRIFSDRLMEREDDKLSENGKYGLKRMQLSAALIQRLIDDLLSFTRIKTAERVFMVTGLQDIVGEVKSELKDMIALKKATIDTSGLLKGRVIRPQFRQLVHTLLSNSLKFAKSETPPLITFKSRVRKGSELHAENPGLQESGIDFQEKYYHISVKDNGIGFKPQFNEKIFEVFQKLHPKETYSGTGIGLAIAKRIVQNHQGFITANGENGEGALFEIYLPFK
jgi:two-component system, chemotaxis family, CheB/CheR fusion protein